MSFNHHLLVVICLATSIGCDREKRKFQADGAMANVAMPTVLLDDVVPGLPPTTLPSTVAMVPAVDPNEFERNAFNLSEGQRLFTQMNCGTCHAGGGGGDIGPTLTDDTWIYGHEPRQIYATIVEGRPNGMPAYGPRLTHTQVWQLSAYVRSLGGLVPKSVAPGRQDTAQTSPPPNSTNPPQTLRSSPPASAGKNEGSR